MIHDGSLFQPYRLLITSSRPGNAGRVLVDTGTTGLSLATLSAASDAVLELGGIGSAGTLVTSSSNLLGQFLAMERALAEIQSQGNVLSQLANLAQFASTNRSN